MAIPAAVHERVLTVLNAALYHSWAGAAGSIQWSI